MDSDGAAAKLRGDRAARGTVAAVLASKLAVVVTGVAVGRQATAGTRAGGGIRERGPPPGFQERDAAGWPERAASRRGLVPRYPALLVGLRQEDAQR